jgi:hypothetical protein
VNTTTVTILFCYLLITTYCVSYCCPKRALNYLDLLCEQNNCYNITLLPFGYLQVCFMLLHKKSTKPFRASNANTAIVTILLCYLLVTSKFVSCCCTKRALNYLELPMWTQQLLQYYFVIFWFSKFVSCCCTERALNHLELPM